MADPLPKKPDSISLEREAPAERFIRTFESDSATLKSGGIPDFLKKDAALPAYVPSADDALSRAAATNAPDTIEVDMGGATLPAGIQRASASAVSSIPSLTAEMMPIDTAEGAPLRQAPPPAPAPSTAAPLHTYTSDFADAVSETNATPTSILAAEQDAAPAPAAAPKSVINISLIVSAVVLIILGAGGAYYAFLYSNKPQTVAVVPLTPAPIFVDERAEISGTGSDLESAIRQSVAKPLAEGAVRLLSLASASSTGTSVFLALQEPAPDILLRNVSAPASLAGVMNVQGVQSPFFILGVASYSDTFAGMLQWEPLMARDLAAIYPAYPLPAPVVATSTKGVATTTAPSITPAATFKDEVVANHDTRVLRDTAGHTLMIYGYWDQKTLILARDEAAFGALIQRLANSRTAQ